MSFKHWERLNDRLAVKWLSKWGQDEGKDKVKISDAKVFAHAPLQGFGEMLTRSIRNRIQRCDGKRICPC